MNKVILCSLAFALTFAVPAAAAAAAAAAAEGTVRLGGFKAYLFSSKTGVMSADMLAKEAPQMGNVPSGEFASVSTFVTVRVDLDRLAPFPHGVQVRLLATESGAMPFSSSPAKAGDRIILNSVSTLGPANAEGMTYVGFWLANTGCRSIGLKAFLVGVKDALPISEVLPFTCYE